MQRILAAIVLCVIGFLPMAEGWSANRAPELPACCRAHGKHQCAMRAASDTAPALYSVCDKYSLPAFGSPAANAPVFQPKAANSVLETLAGKRIAPAQVECLLTIRFERSRPQRGPPSFSS